VTRRAAFVLGWLALGALAPSGGRAHTPITTKMLFNREVVRILKDNCLGCHRPGGIAPMSLATYEEARPWAKAIKEELLERRMPPWPAVRGFGEFRNAPRLSQRDVDVIVNWVEGGAPKGDAALLPEGPLFPAEWPLGAPDLVLTPQAPRAVAADSDEQVDLVLPTGLSTSRDVAAVDLRPGDASVVHCAEISLAGPRPALLGTWVPGSKGMKLPEGVARRIPARSQLRVRIHYRGAGQASADRSSLGLYFAKAGARLIQELVVSEPRTVRESVEAIGVIPRADARLASLQATVYRPDGTSEVLVWTRDHRADWRPTYIFKTPVSIPAGSRLEAIAHLQEPGAKLSPAEPLLTLLYANARRAGASGS
jgi:hypothetical protein